MLSKLSSGKWDPMAAESSLTVLFEPPFWVGLYERMEDGKYQACKITFGAEPKDWEVYEYFLQNWRGLPFSPLIQRGRTADKKRNPKRMRREISRHLQEKGIGTKAQQALKLQQEQGKLERKTRNRAQEDAEKERRYAIRQEKRKAKHRGR